MFKTILKIISTYKLGSLTLLFYEIKYILFLGYKGNKINILNNKFFTDNIPTPYYFLVKIYDYLKNKKIKTIVDVGCGSGRVLYFFHRNNSSYKLQGFEINNAIYLDTLNRFKNNKKIKIINKNFLKKNSKINADLYYLADPFKKNSDYNSFFKKFSKIKKKTYLILVNNNKKVNSLKNFKIIDNFKINKNGYTIYSN